MIKRIRSKARRLSTAVIVCGAIEVTATTTVIAAPPPGTLPVPCSVCVTSVPNAPPVTTWVTSGAATYVTSGNSMTINQSTDRAVLNWQSFNISTDGKVTFKQPDSNSIALNRIYDANATQIFGSLQANGQVYLINQNGFLFGATARVNTGGLLASTLNMTDDVFKNGLLSNTQAQLPALVPFEGADLAKSNVMVEPGAQLTTNAAGQRILLSAKNIDNQGNITANDGQVILAAGEKLYLAASADPELRGLLVEVDGGGTVTNSGTVTTERGNITAVGLAINQNGRMTATTSVASNGSIRLLARDSVRPEAVDGTTTIVFNAQRGDAVTLGANSVTAVNVDANDSSTAVDEQEQFKSNIEVVGKTVQFASGSRVQAAGGKLKVLAASDPSDAPSRSLGAADPGAEWTRVRSSICQAAWRQPR
jgi:filamentous hemagglutinin